MLDLRAPAIVLAILASLGPADAHPHVFADARAEISFDSDGRVAAVRNVWTFDEAFSAFSIAGLDADGDGRIGPSELQTLAEENMDALAESDFFTQVTAGGSKISADAPRDYSNTLNEGRLTLAFKLPLSEPVEPTRPLSIGIFDPEYFVAFEFPEDAPLSLVDAPLGCEATLNRPPDLDAETMEFLAGLPPDLEILPPDLADVVVKLGNHVTITCE